MNLWKVGLKMLGWKTEITVPDRDKCVICVAPHTSNWDFIIGLLAYRSIGRKANFLMKEFWFFFPLKYLLYHLGGIPVRRKKGSGQLTDQMIEKFHASKRLSLAVTPEGTRSATKDWKTGFLYIALGAGVPIQLGVINYKSKTVSVTEEYLPGKDILKDMADIKSYYSEFKSAAKYPEKFIL